MRVANARMYSVNPAVTEAWRSVLRWVIERAQVELEVIDYPAPQPLPALWQRDDLGCAFMCGFPLSHASPVPVVLAAPVPSPAAYRGEAVYWTNLIARNDGKVRTIDDAFGRRIAFTTPDSQSGYQAMRAFFAPHARQRGSPLFATTVGPLVTPRRVVESVLAGEADLGPVDSYAFDLMRHHEPDLIAPLNVIAATMRTPIPPLVGAASLAPHDATRLRDALALVESAPDLAETRQALLLHGFAPVKAATYGGLRSTAAAADAAGYPVLE